MSDAPPPLVIRLFGPPEFRARGEAVRPKTRKGLFILALLTLRHDREVERDWLAGTLWPENDPATALTYLRQTLTDLRRALGDEAERLLSPTPRTLRLDVSDGADVDFVSFGRLLKRSDPASLEQAVTFYRGPLLEGWAEEWLLAERDAARQAYLGALETLASQERAAGNRDAAVRYLRLIVAADPLRESVCRALMQALAAARDYAAVTQAYRDLRLALRREVNAEPDAETQALFARLRAEARRQASGAPPSSGDAPSTASTPANPLVALPRPLSEFIGRVREVEGARRALASSRLVTLTGIGGVGKTRLALRVAEEAADDFADRVRFLDLSSLSDPALVPTAAATALGIGEQPGRPLAEIVCAHLRERQMLLILDNCEHLLDACARFAADVLQACPGVRMLATSRQRLGITGETVRRVPPLTLPDPARLPGDGEKNATSALLEYESIRLFVDRAQRVQPGLVLNPRTLRAIASICSRLDGIPLALELAAARAGSLGPEEIETRLAAKRLRLLSGSAVGDRSAPARQRTLRAVLDWSYDLLLPEERTLLGCLSAFAGGWTLEAAESVCAGDKLEEWEVLDCLTGLVDRSLVVAESGDGEVRYRLLETVREYAQEQLRDGPGGGDKSARLRARHRAYYLGLSEEATKQLSGPGQAEWLDRLEREHDNLRAALDGCLEEGTPEALQEGLRLAVELRQFWFQRGYAGEGRARFAALLHRADPAPTRERARALEGAGGLAFRQGDYAAARELLGEALAVHRARADRGGEAVPLSLLGSIANMQGDYTTARKLMEQALALHRETGYRSGEGAALNNLGSIAVKQGDFVAGQSLYEQALAVSREIGDRAMEGSVLNGLGMLAGYRKDLAGARRWFEQALARNREIGDAVQIVTNLFNLAHAAFEQGVPTEAEEFFRQALRQNREQGASGNRRMTGIVLEGMARTAQALSQPERAARLMGAADAQLAAIGVRRAALTDQESYDRLTAALRSALGDGRFTYLWDEGRTLPADEAVAYALE